MDPLLPRWLDGVPVEQFVEGVLGRAPFARPSAAEDATAYLRWETLGRILERAPRAELDALVVRGGREREVPLPRDLPELRALLGRGLGLVMRRAERHDAGLRALGERLRRDLAAGGVRAGETHVQLFVTAAETNGFGWHYDAEQVFIVQTAGTKDYYLRRNTTDPLPPRPDDPERSDDAEAAGAEPRYDFERIREERSPVLTATLVPGDWLHVPRGWWHVAKARPGADSLSVSVGISVGISVA